MSDLNSRNHFYLGREYDQATDNTLDDKPLLYKSNDLTTHAVCVGMTGSGKTGLCVSLLEEAALDQIPAIIIDPKGDLGNLMLGFSELKPSDFRPWIDESVAERKGMTPDAFATDTAALWKTGLDKWGLNTDSIKQLNDSVERVIFTPGASHGIPMTVLKSFDAPPKALRDDVDAFRQRISSSASGLLALLGIDADPVRSREHILLSNVLKHEWNEGRNLAIADMIQEIIDPPFEKIGVMDVESVYPKKERSKLAMDLNNLLASPSFAGWMEGQPLNVAELYYGVDEQGNKKPRQSIISIAHLDDAQRMFFVTILLNEVIAWMRTQPGTGSLRALLYMDEVFGYFPPTANPPSKEPMLLLLKQARAFGLGCVLATQNPVDLDYKGLSNAGTWFIGRLQTERDKMRVMEGLEGASAQAGNLFDKQAMERTLAGVGSRVFLMNNVHDDQPTLFHTRWAMSYLAGPLAIGQIRTLMTDEIRKKFEIAKVEPPKSQEETKLEDKAEEKGQDQPTKEMTQAPTPDKDLAAKEAIESKFKVRIRDAEASAKKKWSYFVTQLMQVPVQFLVVLFKVVPWAIASATGGATKRKGNSVGSASSATFTELTQAGSAWGEWKVASDQLWDLRQAQEKEISEAQNREEVTLKRPNVLMWTVIAVLVSLFLLALIVGIGLWLLSAYLPKLDTRT